jgi:predicted RNA-binding protein with PIN domain
VDSRQFLIDGDNLIGNWGGPRPGDDRRNEVVHRVETLCLRLHATAVVVFDHPTAAGSSGPVTVMIAPADQTADDVIRRLVDRAPSTASLTVVTSDKPLYSYARTRGAAILRVHEWNALERDQFSRPTG